MSKRGEATLAQTQMELKPEIEEIISGLLDGEWKETALEFTVYLRSKKLTPRYSSTNSWRITYKGKMLCFIKLNNKMERNDWRIVFYLDKYSGEFSQGFKQAIQDNLAPCEACLKACRKGVDLMVFGKVVSNRCFHFPIQFVNPNRGTLEYIKELIEYRKNLIDSNTISPKFFWVYDPTV